MGLYLQTDTTGSGGANSSTRLSTKRRSRLLRTNFYFIFISIFEHTGTTLVCSQISRGCLCSQSMSAITLECTQQTMERWRNRQQAEIDMRCYAEELTLGVIEQVIFGQNSKESREVFVAGKEGQKLAVYALCGSSNTWF